MESCSRIGESEALSAVLKSTLKRCKAALRVEGLTAFADESREGISRERRAGEVLSASEIAEKKAATTGRAPSGVRIRDFSMAGKKVDSTSASSTVAARKSRKAAWRNEKN